MPPEDLVSGYGGMFRPDPTLDMWLRDTFIEEDAALVNEDHAHLRNAKVGTLWTNVVNARAGRSIVGQCELMPPGGSMGKWQKARAAQQMDQWFGDMPDFVITLDADYAAKCDDASFCALVEHELYHAGQAKDEHGAPKFKNSGQPVFAMRGHDIEEFVGVVGRYGIEASGVSALIEAAKRGPSIAPAQIAVACGSCG